MEARRSIYSQVSCGRIKTPPIVGNAEQFNGREGETATFLFSLSVKLKRAWWRFRPTSSQPFDVSW